MERKKAIKNKRKRGSEKETKRKCKTIKNRKNSDEKRETGGWREAR